ncbi:MAG: BtaA family protein [Microscillaceae bacterium]|nr:BtaA family protein [Microscillaceae bacterium]MDW8461062.1 BtaA family protein [Cytophagales bacterium]
MLLSKTLNTLRDKIFSQIHGNNLVYNTCWEDPRCDRQILQFDTHSQIVMITSAGCNALDYLLDNPAQIHCIDVNPRQNALLALKIALFQHTEFPELFKFFGDGVHQNYKEFYQKYLKTHLPQYAQHFWDRNIDYFSGKGLKKSFYYYGTSGSFAWLVNKYLQTKPSTYRKIMQLLEAQTLKQQEALFNEIEPKVINKAVKWILNRHITMSMLGVPRAQQNLIKEKYSEGISAFVVERLRNVFTRLPIQDNYFWRVYLTGKYTRYCCPNYLKKENFEILKQRTSKIQLYTTTISQFLKENPHTYSHFILLDHQDWLAAHNVPALEEEWKLILANSRKGTKILMRSAALEINFFPEFVKEAVDFEYGTLHDKDRVGTYASVYVGTVK